MPTADGQLITLDLTVLVLGVTVTVAGTIEVLQIRRELEPESTE